MIFWQNKHQKIITTSVIVAIGLLVIGSIIFTYTSQINKPTSSHPVDTIKTNSAQGKDAPTQSTAGGEGEGVATDAGRPTSTTSQASSGATTATQTATQGSSAPSTTAIVPSAASPIIPTVPPTPTTPPPASSPATTKPSADNTGPRYSLTRTMTSAEAIAELRATGYLSRVNINGGTLDLESGWVLEDVKISGNSLYMVRAFTASAAPAVKPIIRYAEVSGGGVTSACFHIRYTVVEYSDVSSCIDLFKLGSGATVRYSYAHDIFGVDGAHHDVVQIVAGTDILVEWNNFIGIVTLGTAAGAPRNASGVLQTGSLIGDVRRVYWYDNWVNGAGYTLRGIGAADHAYTVEDFIFRRNKHGRTFTFGPIARMFSPGTANSAWYYNDNVWEDTGQPVQP